MVAKRHRAGKSTRVRRFLLSLAGVLAAAGLAYAVWNVAHAGRVQTATPGGDEHLRLDERALLHDILKRRATP